MSEHSLNPGALPFAFNSVTLPGPQHPDAELIGLCAGYEAAERHVEALYEPDDVDEDQAMASMEAIYNEMTPNLDRIVELRPQTAAGIHARARAMTACNPRFGHSFEAEGTLPHRLLSVLMHDAMALGVAL